LLSNGAQAAIGFLAAALVLGVVAYGSSIFGGDDEPRTRFDLSQLLGTSTPTETLATQQPQEVDIDAPPDTLFLIANTGGEGVRLRSSCNNDALGAGVWPDGAPITPIGRQESCPGWLLAIRGGEVSWVNEQFILVATPTAVPQPTATPSTSVAQAPSTAPTSAPAVQPTTAPASAPASAPAQASAPQPTARPSSNNTNNNSSDEPTDLYRGAAHGGTCTVAGDIVKCSGPQGSWTCTTRTASYFCVGPSGEEESCSEIGNRLYCGATGSDPDSESWTCNRVGSMTTCYGLGDGGSVNCERVGSQLVCRGNQEITTP
jgi:hypothetical protein